MKMGIDLTTDTFFDVSNNSSVLFDVQGATTTIGSTILNPSLEIVSGTTFTPTSELVCEDFLQNGSFRTGAARPHWPANGVATGTSRTRCIRQCGISLAPRGKWATTTAGDNDLEDVVMGRLFVAVGEDTDVPS